MIIIKKINRLFPDAEILILTNGRALALPDIMNALKPLITDRYCFAIPIHGPDGTLHDAITSASGSFRQSVAGIRALSGTDARIEVRIVGHRFNLDRIGDTFRMLCSLKTRIDVINLIAMEMTGCAARNRDMLWVDYDVLSIYKGMLEHLFELLTVGDPETADVLSAWADSV